MSYSNFISLYEKLNNINEATLSEQTASEIDLSKCRVITSDVKDIRGELEANSCLEYNGELTRVQVRTVIIRETENGREFLAKKFRYRTSLPGGGYDQEKDNGDILKTAKREALEEFNFILSNVEDTGVRTWRSREDSWVAQHIKNPEDRWTGYYSYFIVGTVSGSGNNENPEEINKWKWYPIADLEKVNKEVYNYVMNLDEAIRPDKKGRVGLGEISYLCGTLETLRTILKTMEIQKTYVREVRYEKGEFNGNTQRIKQYSVSTSTDLTGHAKRRPNKWGFGVIIDGAELSRYYDIEPYNHADHKLLDLKITKLVKLKPGAISNSRVIVGFGEYGNRIISNKDDADLRIYDIIKDLILNNQTYWETARQLNYYLDRKDPTSWRYRPFGKEGGNKVDSRFTHLVPEQVEEIFSYKPPYSKNGIPLKDVRETDPAAFFEIQDIMKNYTSFDEAEERVWVENELINYLQIPPSALRGIILPSFFKEEYETGELGHEHLAWLKQFVEKNNLRVDWHDYVDTAFYKSQLDASNSTGTLYRTKGKERFSNWDEIDDKESSPEAVLQKARRLANITKAKNVEVDNSTIKSQVATSAVKQAIKDVMVDLTYENFDEKYKEALGQARLHYRLAGYEFRAKSKADRLFTELFDYYCPEKPEREKSRLEKELSEMNDCYDVFSAIIDSESDQNVKDFIRLLKREYPNNMLLVAYDSWFRNKFKENFKNKPLPIEISYKIFIKLCTKKYNLTETDLEDLFRNSK